MVHAIEDNSPEFAEQAKQKIAEFNAKHWDASKRQALGLKQLDAHGEVIAMLAGRTFGNWFYLESFWLADNARGKGLGSAMLNEAEQIAKARGCRVVGIAGGPEKCAKLTEKYGFDAAIDYKGKDEAALTKAIAEAAPNGVDVIFENVGGIILDAGLMNLNLHSRVGLCGLISEYNTEPRGIRNLWQLIVKRAHIRGLLVADYVPRFAEGAAQMGVWAAQGKLTIDEHIDEGLEHAFDSFMRLFAGTNDGKMILKIA